jgi:hypothetical protein
VYLLAAPAGDCVNHGTKRTDWKRQKLSADPTNGRNTGCEKGYVEDNSDENEDAGPVDTCSLQNEVSVDWDKVKCNGSDNKTDCL